MISKKYYGEKNYYNINYNSKRQISSISYQEEIKYKLEYDKYNRLIKEINVLDGSRNKSYEYNEENELIKETEAEKIIEYKYNNKGEIVGQKRKVKEYEIREEIIGKVGSTRTELNRIEGLFNETGVIGTYYVNNLNLKGVIEKETKVVYGDYQTIYNGSNCLIKKDNIYTIELKFELIYEIETTNKGSIGFWIKAKKTDNRLIPLLSLKDEEEKSISLAALNKKIIVILNDGEYSLEFSGEKAELEQEEWTYICFSYEIEELEGTCRHTYKLYVNDKKFELSSTYYNYPKISKKKLVLGACEDGGIKYNLEGNITALAVKKEEIMDDEYIIKYYKYTKDYIILNETIKGIDYDCKIDIEKDNNYEIYPLHNTLESLNGKRPTLEEKNSIFIADKEDYFNYNTEVNRYCYICSGNELEYQLNSFRSGSVSVNIYVDRVEEKQYIFELYDSSDRRISIWLDENGYVYLRRMNLIDKTNLKVCKKKWTKVKLSYGLTSSRKYNIYLTVGVSTKIYDEVLENEYGYLNIRLGIGKDEEIDSKGYKTKYPLYGQMELFSYYGGVTNDKTPNIKMEIKNNEYDEFERKVRSSVSNNEKEIIKKEIKYKEENNNITGIIKEERIKYGGISQIINYESDKEGRITKISDTIFGNKEYVYNLRGYLISENGVTITYDDNGNILRNGNNVYTYDTNIKDRLITYNGKEIKYEGRNPFYISEYDGKIYNYEGNRLVSIKTKTSSTYNYYKYDIKGRRIQKYHTFNQNGTKYYYQNGLIITEYTDNDRIDYLYDTNSNLYGFIYNKEERYYYIRDELQNIKGIIDESGQIVGKYSYTAYGCITIELDTNNIASRNPFRYKGYYYDIESNLYWVSSRYYSPELCRWISPDDIEYLDPESINGLNLYCYCGNDPINYVDPTGHFGIWALVAITTASMLIGGTAQLVSNALAGKTGSELWRGVAGAAVGTGVNALALCLALPTGGASLFIAAGASSIVQTGVDTLETIIRGEDVDVGQTFIDLGLNFVTAVAGNYLGGKMIPTNPGWFQPQKFLSVFTKSYGQKILLQTAIGAGLSGTVNFIRKNDWSKYKPIIPVPVVPLCPLF